MHFTSTNDRAYMSPSSSPASSPDSSPDPFTLNLDSSPSPETLDPVEDGMDDDEAPPIHPYAGSRHGKPPRMYEKKKPLVTSFPLFSSPSTPPPPQLVPVQIGSSLGDFFEEEETPAAQGPCSEEERWLDAIQRVVDEGEQLVDLSCARFSLPRT
jgi:hypothetical protein